MGLKHWSLRQGNDEIKNQISSSLGLGSLASATLAARGYDSESASRFIGGDGAIHSPFLLKDMDKAVQRIRYAIENDQTIAVFGDYDCDGITATALLYNYFEMEGARVYYYIPSRETEGYGLNKNAIAELKKLKVDLIVTVDNGVSAIEEVDYAASLGIDVVVTDHHQPREELPRAVAVVNPHRIDCEYPFKGLAGVGVAFKLVCALEDEIGYETLEYFSDLLAIGTIADVVTLSDENRYFVRRGLLNLAESSRPGIAAILEHCKLSGKPLTTESVAFSISPRLNAAGRVGEPDTAVMLFLTDRISEAHELCETLESFNQARKDSEKNIYEDIISMIDSDSSYLTRRTLTLFKEGWNSGTVGIVCSRIVDRYEKPCLLISLDGDEARGSARSVQGFSIIEAISNCSDLLLRYGGHPLAAGFTLNSANAAGFAQQIEDFAERTSPIMPTAYLTADCEISPNDLSINSVTEIDRLAPFGAGNETPIFVMRGLRIERVMPTADGRHIRVAFLKDGKELTSVFFGTSPSRFPYMIGDRVDIAFNTDINLWNDKKSVNIKLKDVRLSDVDIESLIDDKVFYYAHLRGEIIPEEKVPDRDDVAAAYRLMKTVGKLPADRDYIACRLSKMNIGFTKSALACDVLLELGLVSIEESENGRHYLVSPVTKKVNLDNSRILSHHRKSATAV